MSSMFDDSSFGLDSSSGILGSSWGSGGGMGGGSNYGTSGTGIGGYGGFDPNSLWNKFSAGMRNTGTKIGQVLGNEKFNTGMSAFGDLMSIYTGFKSLGLAKDQFKFQKRAWNKNYDAQAKDYENNLKDRWAARNASATTRGRAMEGMDSWVNDRKIG